MDNTGNCGIGKLSLEYNTTIENLKNINRTEFAFVNFSDAIHESNEGAKFAKYIKQHKLGSLICTKAKQNPNSGNTIKQWTLTPNYRRIKTHLNKLEKEEDND